MTIGCVVAAGVEEQIAIPSPPCFFIGTAERCSYNWCWQRFPSNPSHPSHLTFEHLSLYIQKYLRQSVAVCVSLWKGRSWQTKAEPSTSRYSCWQSVKVWYSQVQPGTAGYGCLVSGETSVGCPGHHLGHVWGMSGASSGVSSGACLVPHLGHVWGIIWGMSWAWLGHHQQWSTFCGATCICDAVIYLQFQ